jgi:hypothetical protein
MVTLTLQRIAAATNSIRIFSRFAQKRTVSSMQFKNGLSNRLRSNHSIRSEVALTELEAQICQLLDECTQKLKAEKNIATSCRIAGGWVRDKVSSYVTPFSLSSSS